MNIKLSKSQWELIGKKAGWIKTAEPVMPSFSSLNAVEAYNFAKKVKFNRSEIPDSVINTIAEDPRCSWKLAKNLKFIDIPQNIIDSIAKNQYLSYLWIRYNDFDIDNIPSAIVEKAVEDRDERAFYNPKWGRYISQGIKDRLKRNQISI